MHLDGALKTFQAESEDLLIEMEELLLSLEDEPENDEILAALFRAIHTIKGNSGIFDFNVMVTFTHVAESVMDKVRSKQLTVDKKLIALLLEVKDHISSLLIDSLAEKPCSASTELMARLNTYLGTDEIDSTSANVTLSDSYESNTWFISVRFDSTVLMDGMDPASFLKFSESLGSIIWLNLDSDAMPEFSKLDPVLCYFGYDYVLKTFVTMPIEEIESIFDFVRSECRLYILPQQASSSQWQQLLTQHQRGTNYLKAQLLESGIINEDTFNTAKTTLIEETKATENNTQAELSYRSTSSQIRIDSARLDELVNLVGEMVIAGAANNNLVSQLGDARLLESSSKLEKLTETIRDRALELRMVPIGDTFKSFKRVIRDVSKKLDKEVDLLIQGGETELDKMFVEKLKDPLMHLIRNSLDHGLEPTEARIAAGKSAKGRVLLKAYQDSGMIVIQVRDDGQGINKEKVLSKAIEKGLVDSKEQLTNKQIYNLIFSPGFSTAAEVSDISGRGVGMDVVRKNIEAVSGSIDVDSRTGQGSIFTLRVPLTLAIIDGFLINIANHKYVLPLSLVKECIEISTKEYQAILKDKYINFRGVILPTVSLATLWGAQDYQQPLNPTVVVVRYGKMHFGFLVDALIGECQTVIKPLGRMFEHLKGFSGSTILGDGTVALIIEVSSSIELAKQKYFTTINKLMEEQNV